MNLNVGVKYQNLCLRNINTEHFSPTRKRQRHASHDGSPTVSAKHTTDDHDIEEPDEPQPRRELHSLNVQNSVVQAVPVRGVRSLNDILLSGARKHVTYNLVTMSKIQMAKIYFDYHEYRLYDRTAPFSMSKEDHRRMKVVVWYMNTHATQEQLNLAKQEEPDRDKPEWITWNRVSNQF